MNLFVSLEEILDITLCFTTWLLIADHFASKHEYNIGLARTLVANELNGLITTAEGPVIFDPNGRNNLFPLINGFLALEKRVQTLAEQAGEWARPRVLYPHFVGKTDLEAFPYRHTHFLCDLPDEDRARVLNTVGSTGRELQGGAVLEVRNRIDHHSEAFPTGEDVEKCCETLEKAVKELESRGLVPTVYVPKTIEKDIYNRTRVTSADYDGREFVWAPSPALQGILSLPPIGIPQILVKDVYTPGTDEIVRFDLKEESDFTRLWSDYPKRRGPTHADIQESSEAPGREIEHVGPGS